MRPILLIFLLFFSSSILGQKNYKLTFSTNAYQNFKKIPTDRFTDSIQAHTYLKLFQSSAVKEGYLLASIDSISYLKNELKAGFYLGPIFKKAFLTISNEDIQFFKKHMHVNEKFLTGISFSPNTISSILNKMQNTLENNGYPFGKVSLDSVTIKNENLYANVIVQKNQFFKWTEIHIKGDTSISKVFLTNIIRIKEGDKYNADELKSISQRLKQINFLKEIKPHEILFTNSGVELFLYIKSNPVSSVNGAVGLQPDSKSEKVSLTGDLSLKLLNTLKKGELLDFNWKSLQSQTQSVKAKLNYPFILNSPFGIDAQLNLYKRDTTYLETKSNIGIQYFLKGGNYFKVFYQNYSSSILSGGKNNPNFVNLGSVKSNNYGISLNRKQLDYVPNPSRGFVLESEISIGTKKFKITDTSAVINSNNFRGEVNMEFYVQVAKRHILKLSNQTEFYNNEKIFQNEVYRFGGLNSQRGFNEEELFATTKSIVSIEYRFLVDKNSRAFLFYDQSWYENNSTISYYNDKPFGFGAGFSFGTNLGIFSISYGLGKQLDNPILIRNGKIHFGYITYF
jgi:outer membrane protein assembly factor BamA